MGQEIKTVDKIKRKIWNSRKKEGVSDDDIDKIQSSGISNSSQYKLAGNSIVAGGNQKDKDGNVDGVLYNIFIKMFIEKENESSQLTLF